MQSRQLSSLKESVEGKVNKAVQMVMDAQAQGEYHQPNLLFTFIFCIITLLS